MLGERWSPRQIQDRHIITKRLRQSTHRVLRTGTALGDDHTEFFTVVHTAVAVRSHEGAAFLPEHDRANAFLSHRLNEIVGREASHPLDPFQLQDTRNGLHRIHSVSSTSVITCNATVFSHLSL